ncbi:MAG: hypothetical protein WCG91_03805 [Candidatus Shapirobacteria bacterium]
MKKWFGFIVLDVLKVLIFALSIIFINSNQQEYFCYSQVIISTLIEVFMLAFVLFKDDNARLRRAGVTFIELSLMIFGFLYFHLTSSVNWVMFLWLGPLIARWLFLKHFFKKGEQ